MCDARQTSGEAEAWARVDQVPEFQDLLRDALDNLVDLPDRDEPYVRRQLIAFANCVKQQTAKEILFMVAEDLTNSALRAPEWGLKRMDRECRLAEERNHSKTSGDSTTSDGNPFEGSNS